MRVGPHTPLLLIALMFIESTVKDSVFPSTVGLTTILSNIIAMQGVSVSG